MLVEPGFEGREVEDEAGDDDGRVVDVRDLDYAFAVGGSEPVNGGADPVTRFGRSVDVVDHDDGAGRGECVEGSHSAVSDLLEDLVTLVEFCAGHCCEAPGTKRCRAAMAREERHPRGRSHVSGRRPGG